jgi:uncharacterized protein
VTSTGVVEARVDDGVTTRRGPQPYMHPYLAGIGIGVALLAAFVVMGRGLGASGAFSSVVSVAVAEAAPAHAAGNAAYAPYLGDGTRSPFADWLIFEIIGVTIGGFLSAWLAGRFHFSTDRGPHVATRQRLVFALVGGALMGFGARLARGCTSGLALTGGALLAPGAWIFIGAAFAAGFAAAPLLRRQWL